MAKKRKSDVTRLDEVDTTMYSTFCGAANSLSQLYTQAMNHQKVAFQAGERHALEKLYQWIVRQHGEGARVTTAEVVSHLQNEIGFGGDDSTMFPRVQLPYQNPPPSTHFTNLSSQGSSAATSMQPAVGLAPRVSHLDQAKNSVFSNALSSPVRRSLQPYHLAAHGGVYYSNDAQLSPNGPRGHDRSSPHNNLDSGSPSSSSMDMNSDGPTHGSY